MAITYPLPTLAAVVTATGISAPSYAEIYQSLQASFQSIYGTDAYIAPDSKDGQLLAVFAKAINDANNAAIAAYNNYSPATSRGAGLSSAVKINGIRRLSPSNSQVTVLIVGQVGTVINAGIISDRLGTNQWTLPTLVTIPIAGEVEVTATCTTVGSVEAVPNTLTKIVTPTRGWQTVTNPGEASAGAPVESDATLRRRQVTSVALPSQTVLAGILGAVAAVEGVTESVIYENDTMVVNADGLPPKSIAVVVLGGDSAQIANAIYLKKTPGAYTYGTTEVVILNAAGIPTTIRYFEPTSVAVMGEITVRPLIGFTSVIENQIKATVAAYINDLSIGKRVDMGRLYLPAQLYGAAGIETYEVNAIEIAVVPGPVGAADVPIAFNARATCDVTDLIINVVP